MKKKYHIKVGANLVPSWHKTLNELEGELKIEYQELEVEASHTCFEIEVEESDWQHLLNAQHQNYAAEITW